MGRASAISPGSQCCDDRLNPGWAPWSVFARDAGGRSVPEPASALRAPGRQYLYRAHTGRARLVLDCKRRRWLDRVEAGFRVFGAVLAVTGITGVFGLTKYLVDHDAPAYAAGVFGASIAAFAGLVLRRERRPSSPRSPSESSSAGTPRISLRAAGGIPHDAVPRGAVSLGRGAGSAVVVSGLAWFVPGVGWRVGYGLGVFARDAGPGGGAIFRHDGATVGSVALMCSAPDGGRT